MDKVQKLSNSECYTPSSEPFRIKCGFEVFTNDVLHGTEFHNKQFKVMDLDGRMALKRILQKQSMSV
jgi:hypothetical protein